MNPVRNHARASSRLEISISNGTSHPMGLEATCLPVGRAVSNGMKRYIEVSGSRRFQRRMEPLRRNVRRMLSLLRKGGSLKIFLVGSDVMRKNVLAFPAVLGFPDPDVPSPFLGEIYLNPDCIEEQDESLEYMALHGILHLLGYDHTRTHDRIRMERKERTVLKQLEKKGA